MIQQTFHKAHAFLNRSFSLRRSTHHLPVADPVNHSDRTHRRSSFETWLFAREILRNPRAMGAACPSSRRLAQAMAAVIPLNKTGLVVELGAGTGKVTDALLKHGITGDRLIAVERSSKLAGYLHSRFPQITVLTGDAAQLAALLATDHAPLNAIVSGLPLRSLPRSVVRDIMQQVKQLLPADGLFIQFTYDLAHPNAAYLTPHFQRIHSQIIWQNFPPARIDVYQPCAQH